MNTARTKADLEDQHGIVTDQTRFEARAHDVPLTLEQFRALVGIPQDLTSKHGNETATSAPGQNYASPTIRPATIRVTANTKPRALIFLRLLSRPSPVSRTMAVSDEVGRRRLAEEDERASSIFYSLIREESDQWRLYHIYNVVTYTCLVLQLVIASALIIIGAVPSPESRDMNTYRAPRIAVAILGAVTGLLTGIMSLLKGQGLPTRFLQYASRLRQVRERIEFLERTLRANVESVSITYQDVVELWQDFESVINERDMNKPDAWATTNSTFNIRHNKDWQDASRPVSTQHKSDH